jgi:chaperonin cofactor prefoldin
MVVKKGSIQIKSSVLDEIEKIDETKPVMRTKGDKITANTVSVAQYVSINYKEFMSRTTNVANDKTDHVWPFLVKVSSNGLDEEG